MIDSRLRMEAWIEISAVPDASHYHLSRLRMEAWIEMDLMVRDDIYSRSPPYGGVD